MPESPLDAPAPTSTSTSPRASPATARLPSRRTVLRCTPSPRLQKENTKTSADPRHSPAETGPDRTSPAPDTSADPDAPRTDSLTSPSAPESRNLQYDKPEADAFRSPTPAGTAASIRRTPSRRTSTGPDRRMSAAGLPKRDRSRHETAPRLPDSATADTRSTSARWQSSHVPRETT